MWTRAASAILFAVFATASWGDVTPNLIGNGVGTGSGQWSGMSAYSQLNGQHPIAVFGCCTSFGTGPFFDSSTGSPNGQSGQFIWSYGQATVSQIIAVNQALSGSGIQINGYNWGYEVRNMNGDDRQGGVDQLTATTFLKHTNGSVLLSDTRTYNTKQEWNWHGGTVTATSPYALADVGQVGIQFTAMDSGFWAGYYGPQVRNVDLSLNYTSVPVDPCTVDPLSSPSCPGYQQAYHDQQCSINSLYATSCPGYQQAYYTQQCSINPLYDSTCPGYQAAFYNQQCSANPLYDTGCPGYQQAYFDQQCSLDPLYNNQCPGYQQAYFDQQCTANALYSEQCPGYAAAYFNQQCGLDPLYNASCAGYQSAYFALQCSISPLYDTTCPGYQTAFFNQQCTANALYDSACPGYQQAYYDQQCAANPLYDSGCANYDVVLAATQPVATEESTSTTVVAQADITASVTAASEPTATTSTTSPTSVSPAAVVSAVRPAPAPAAPTPSSRAQSAESARQETRAAEKKTEQKRTDRAVAKAVPPGATGRAAAQAAAEKADEAIADAATATTIEAQQAAQNLVLGLMGFNPAFSAYQNAIVPDTNAAAMARQYNQPTVDNRRALRGLSGASDRMHQGMVDQQYGRMPR